MKVALLPVKIASLQLKEASLPVKAVSLPLIVRDSQPVLASSERSFPHAGRILELIAVKLGNLQWGCWEGAVDFTENLLWYDVGIFLIIQVKRNDVSLF